MIGAPVRWWLRALLALVALMVLVGGVTRLTGSGLSMVEWRPLMGALPPLNEAEWLGVFEKYKRSPQYLQVNDWMQLADFKRIFFWEYFHRLLGRLVGVVFFVPWVWFLVRKRLPGPWRWRTLLAGVFGGLQGLLGWFMVKSGLVDIPAVSHYRLAAHLSLAFFVACWIAWLLFESRDWERETPRPLRGTWALVALVTLQIVYGAFMAGSRAGYLFQSFPTLHGEWIPSAGFATARAWLDDPVTIHFLHRTLGYIVGLAVAAWWWRARRDAGPMQRRGIDQVGAWALAQVALGIATVVLAVPLSIAVAHQVVALFLLLALLDAAWRLRGAR